MSGSVAVKPRRSVDWRHAARLWVKGIAPAAIAAELGISEERLWVHRERSARFRRFVQIAAAQNIQKYRRALMVNLVRDKHR